MKMTMKGMTRPLKRGPRVGAYYNGPKFKCQLERGTGGFSYNIWTKNSKEPDQTVMPNFLFLYNVLLEKCFKNWFLTKGSAPTGKCMKVKVHVF